MSEVLKRIPRAVRNAVKAFFGNYRVLSVKRVAQLVIDGLVLKSEWMGLGGALIAQDLKGNEVKFHRYSIFLYAELPRVHLAIRSIDGGELSDDVVLRYENKILYEAWEVCYDRPYEREECSDYGDVECCVVEVLRPCRGCSRR